MITAIALDDELPALEIIELYCSKIETIDLKKVFSKTSEARFYLEENAVDLIFLDINMPSHSGIDFYKSISQKTMVIFTTAYSEYAVESYEFGAIDYLLKPFSFERFNKAVEKVVEQNKLLAQSNENQLYFRIDYGLTKVSIQDIIFIEGLDNYIKIHLTSQKPILVRMTIKNILEKLPLKQFCRVHRSYIISMSKITSYRNKMIYIADNEIPLGKTYEDAFLGLLNI
ncbi:LytTR family DNA-binding domain-containing protein [Flavobacterium sp. MC2016-06]|jgi:DNA-binding LytR/AlgR family response regulator|uniref:LytR/AlgR family response regulator transcription factor n=1 Tax=Flavobacterium sp. MC2016-06 TaxID=2676308 RepID=UPI0012BADA8E|nr:LytTR family DNA-binding domain-containing protein [Flavobacterium sp. MC2016-06]MBU3857532.1 LytTR family DNA-binding domain-containing protein [Flavobacterium sp. MC2016-06]